MKSNRIIETALLALSLLARAVLLKQLEWPHKLRQGQLAFLCPRCQEYRSAVHPRTNLGRCFACQTNFNPREFTMAEQECDFVAAVHYLAALLLARRLRREER